MLVCSVSLRRRQVTVAADVIEAAAALDNPATVMLFGTLLDSPGDAKDILDAFVGQQIKEAANAVATVSVAMAYKIALLEDTTAVSAVQGLVVGSAGVVTAAVDEAASATETLDGVIALVPRQAMVGSVFVNSDGTRRQANAVGTMLNL